MEFDLDLDEFNNIFSGIMDSLSDMGHILTGLFDKAKGRI